MTNNQSYIVSLIIGVILGYMINNKVNHRETMEIFPEKKGQTEHIIIKDTIKEKEVVVRYRDKPHVKVVVDDKWKNKYDQTKDSLERLNLYYQAIKIKNYEKKILDDDNLDVIVKGKVRGDILSYQASYTIKSDNTSYLSRNIGFPRLSGGLGLSLGTPLNINHSSVIKVEGFIQNKKGWQYKVGYDTQKRVWIGVNKNFKILK